jgi:uncharacterized repeat protein (TIGR03803 family)
MAAAARTASCNSAAAVRSSKWRPTAPKPCSTPSAAGLTRKGNLFGTTAYGGSAASQCTGGETTGCGVVFEVTTSGKEKTLYAFQGNSDGMTPVAGVIEDKTGNLYGATQAGGGASACAPVGCGIVFEIAHGGGESVLYTFTGMSDGAHPSAGLLADAKGDLYGTTLAGGSGADSGTVFKLGSDRILTVLNDFSGGTNGGAPVAPLIEGTHGVLYGTTELGSDGTVFRVKK